MSKIKNGRYENNGTISWYLNDELHRLDGPAIEYDGGTNEWFLNGVRHREDGPAIESENGSKEWYFFGKCHRENGPAVEDADGTKEWFFRGQELTEEEFNQWKDKKVLNEKLEHTLINKIPEKRLKI